MALKCTSFSVFVNNIVTDCILYDDVSERELVGSIQGLTLKISQWKGLTPETTSPNIPLILPSFSTVPYLLSGVKYKSYVNPEIFEMTSITSITNPL